ncbi:MAG: response regulator transcription factor [Cyclobacteriaceae bacterium]
MTSLQILILDDHSLYSKGLEKIIQDHFSDSVIRSFSSIKRIREFAINLNDCDLLISDIELPDEDIFQFLKEVMGDFPNLPILVISMHKKLSIIRKCKQLGVQGYILKDEDQYLVQAIQETINGAEFYSPRIQAYYHELSEDLNKISEREEQIIKLICEGHSNQSIADQLHISIETIKTHKKNIKRKIGYTDISELMRYAKERMLF